MRNLRFTDWVFVVAAVAMVVVAALTLFRPTPGPAHSAHQRAAPADLLPAAHSDGLSETEGGYRFERVTTPDTRGPAVPVAFRIIGERRPPSWTTRPNSCTSSPSATTCTSSSTSTRRSSATPGTPRSR
ncbi:hypothetical protein FHS29_000482 [Saccharothrix tamanrassetensis]|uniref:Uncharacterized protein n=1 Tax=Saccharothrix tamanrassetensis TaxID=1051531 RepID=A0A841C5U8_9PSEU|nr:hypothetical protein [Saccharothrix tamanrassetensis]MBB5953912.1 hypothetical protein [Saccharothrix tamanrassetensis]